MWGDIINKLMQYKYSGDLMRGLTKFMIVLISFRLVSIIYITLILEVKAGWYGLYQIPIMLPLYAVLLLLCFIFIVRQDLEHIGILSLHIFTIFYMFFDVLFYINSIAPDSPF